MEKLKIFKGENETSIKKLAKRLNVSYSKAKKAIDDVAFQYDCPRYMVFSTNHKGQPLYSVKRFAEILGIYFEII